MRKVRNVNKIVFFILFLAINTSVFSQIKIQERFHQSSNFYKFYSDNTFEYKQAGELGILRYGKGHYTFTKDSLILNFDLTDITPKGYYILKPYESFTDSINLKINVFDFDKQILKEAEIIYKDDSGTLNGKDIKEGKIELTFRKQKEEVSLIFAYEDSTFSFNVPRYSHFEIDVFLSGFSDYKGNAIKYETWKYKIVKIKEDYFEVKTPNGNKLKYERTKEGYYADDPFE